MHACPPSRPGRGHWLACLLGLATVPQAAAQQAAPPEQIHFDRETLRSLGVNIDVSAFEKSANALPAGMHALQFVVNGVHHGELAIRIAHAPGDARQIYCFDASQIATLGIRLPPAAAGEDDPECIDLPARLSQAQVEADLARATLRITVPQAYLEKRPRHHAPPETWDSGLNAGFIAYNTHVDRARRDGRESQDSYFLGLNAGLNLQGWRLRHAGTLRGGDSAGGSGYDTINSYVQRDLTALSSQLTLGEYFTPGDLFDSIPFTGVQLESDERMLPENQRGYAPEIRGVADGNATVTIRQSGQVVYETTVPAGPFVIDDLYSAGFADNLEVTVTEADGREKRFTVPYSHTAELLRAGSSRYFLTGGRYRAFDAGPEMNFVQGGYRRGVNNAVTLYAGGVAAEAYRSALVGAGFNTALGAIAVDATFAGFDAGFAPGQAMPTHGGSYRAGYYKTFAGAGTRVQAVYRRSDRGYLGLSTAVQATDAGSADRFREKERATLSLSQSLGRRSSLFLSGVAQTYWTGEEDNITYSAGINSSFGWGSLGLSLSRFNTADDHDTQYLATISLPLGRRSGAPYLGTSLTYRDRDDYNLQSSLSGAFGEQQQASYNLYGTTGRGAGGHSQSQGATLRLRTSAATLGASASRGDDSRRGSLSARGSVVAYRGGLAFSPGQGETMAIVEAEGARGARLRRGQTSIGGNGKALVTGLTPYRRNELILDPEGSQDRVEIKENIQSATPRYGAIVRVPYQTRQGAPMLLALTHSQATAIPFGATVTNQDGEAVAHVAQGQLVLLRASGKPDAYHVSWRAERAFACRFLLPGSESSPPAQGMYHKVPIICEAEEPGIGTTGAQALEDAIP